MAASAEKRQRVDKHEDKVRDGIRHLETRGVFAYRATLLKKHGLSKKSQDEIIVNEILYLTDPTKASQQKLWQDRQERMLWLMEGDQFCDSLTFNQQEVQHFEDLPTHAEYDRDKLPPVFGQSVQRHGTCFMNGPAVLQHDLVNRHLVQQGREATQQSLNMLHWLRNHGSAESLDAYVFDDSGGNALTILKSILVEGSVVFNPTTAIADNLELYGPGLVMFDQAPEDFMEETKCQHFGASNAPLLGGQSTAGTEGHAVVVIGIRREGGDAEVASTAAAGGDREIFLLQNWWPRKQFVEVDAEYLESCGASVWFVKTPQTQTRDEFARNVNAGLLRVSHDVCCKSNRQRYGPC